MFFNIGADNMEEKISTYYKVLQFTFFTFSEKSTYDIEHTTLKSRDTKYTYAYEHI